MLIASAGASAQTSVPVTVENFVRAETDLYFANAVRGGGFGDWHHIRELLPIDHQTVIRGNRDTLYSLGTRYVLAGVRTLVDPDDSGDLGRAHALQDAIYLNLVPASNDGTIPHAFKVEDVPVDGFWSVSVYNDKGYYEKNAAGAYSLNSVTAKKDADGTVTIRFGGCEVDAANCLPIMPGWNYMVRLYRPRAEALNGQWNFPAALPVR